MLEETLAKFYFVQNEIEVRTFYTNQCCVMTTTLLDFFSSNRRHFSLRVVINVQFVVSRRKNGYHGIRLYCFVENVKSLLKTAFEKYFTYI